VFFPHCRQAGLLAGLAFSLCISGFVSAQSAARVSGRVTDVSGGVIPGAEVTLTSQLTGAPRDTITDANGEFAFRDTAAGHSFEWWGQDNCMWSNDYPHGNSTWPDSLKVIRRDLGHLPRETQAKVLAANACRLYGIDTAALPEIKGSEEFSCNT